MEWPQTSSSRLQSRTACDIYIVSRIQLDVLQCRFLLQRLLASRGFSDGQESFNIAQETMALIVSLWLHRDQLQQFCHAFDWIVSCTTRDTTPADIFQGCLLWISLRGRTMR